MIKKIILFIFMSMSFMSVGFAAGENNFKAVQMQLSKTAYLTGHFVQIRDIKLLSSPLKSEGDFTFSKKKGLVWKQLKPFQSTLTVTDSRLTQRIGNGP